MMQMKTLQLHQGELKFSPMEYLLKEGGENSLHEYVKRRLTIKQLAERVGLSQHGLRNILKGESNPSPGNLKEIARELNLHWEYRDGEHVFTDEFRKMDVETYEFYEKLKADPTMSEIIGLLDKMPEHQKRKWVEVTRLLFSETDEE